MSELSLLRDQVLEDLGESDAEWHNPSGYASAALCVLDSIYSTGNHYTGVTRLVDTYCSLRRDEGADPQVDRSTDLVEAVARWGGVDTFVERTGYRWKTSTRSGAPYKAEAALGAAVALQANGLETVDDIRAALSVPSEQEPAPIKRAWLALPGQRSGLTWNYFLMLAGVPGVKADRMVTSYVGRALGRKVDAKEAAALVSALADERQVSRTKLDHAIWRKESGREVYVRNEEVPA